MFIVIGFNTIIFRNSNQLKNNKSLYIEILKIIFTSLLKVFAIFSIIYSIKLLDKNILLFAIVLVIIISLVNIKLRKNKDISSKYGNLKILPDSKLRQIFTVILKEKDIHKYEIYLYNNNKINSHVLFCNNKWNIFLSMGTIKRLNIEEVIAIFYHEIGHIKFNHKIKKNIYTISLNILLLIVYYILIFSIKNISIISGILLCILFSDAFIFLYKIMINYLLHKQEFNADYFSYNHYSKYYILDVLNKILSTNKDISYNNLLQYYCNNSHPTIKKRLLNLP